MLPEPSITLQRPVFPLPSYVPGIFVDGRGGACGPGGDRRAGSALDLNPFDLHIQR